MQITEITVTLEDVAPEVTRKLEVPADIALDRLHEVLQAAFGWDNAHLFMFCAGEPYQSDAERWVMPGFADSPEELPADQTTLARVLAKTGVQQLTYLYDFGDDWQHRIDIGKTAQAEPSQTYPRLTAITGTCPPDDIGGPPGYEMFLEAMADPEHPQHEELRDWHGGPFNPDKPEEAALRKDVAALARKWSKKP